MPKTELEAKVDDLEGHVQSMSYDMNILTHQQAKLNDSFNTITDLLVRQARAEEQTEHTMGDTKHNTKEINRIDKEGTSVCAVHQKENQAILQRIEELQKSMGTRDRIMLTVAFIFASGLVGLFFTIIKEGIA